MRDVIINTGSLISLIALMKLINLKGWVKYHMPQTVYTSKSGFSCYRKTKDMDLAWGDMREIHDH